MSIKSSGLKFPSGLSVIRAKKRAKDSVKAGGFKTLTEAQNSIAQCEVGLPWSKAMKLIRSSGPTTSFMTQSDIELIMKEIPELTHFGYGAYMDHGKPYMDHGKPYKEYLASVEKEKESLFGAVDECNKACMYLQHLDKRKTINTVFSNPEIMEWSAPLPKRLQLSQDRMSCSDIIQNKKRSEPWVRSITKQEWIKQVR